MEKENFCQSIYYKLLQAAEKDTKDSQGTKSRFLASMLRNVSNTLLLFKLLQLALDHYQGMKSTHFKCYDKLSKHEIVVNASAKEALIQPWNDHGRCTYSGLFIYNKVHLESLDARKENFSTEIDSVFNHEAVDLLASRASLIKALVKKLEDKLYYRFYHINIFDYFVHRLRYQVLLTHVKKGVLVWASRMGAVELVEWMCEQPIGNNEKKIALKSALAEKQWEIVKYLYQQDTPIDEEDLGGFIEALIQMKAVEFIQTLLEKGLPCDQKNNQITKLMMSAMEAEQDEIVYLLSDYLLKKLLNQKLLLTDNLKQVLLCATRQGYTRVIKVLLEAGMPIDTCDKEGRTLLLTASQRGYSAMVDFLQIHGASVNSASQEKAYIIKALNHRKGII